MTDYIDIKQSFTVADNRRIGPKSFAMRLDGPTHLFSRPGQFVNVDIPGLFLRRPISVCDYDPEGLTLLYDVVGKGTDIMSQWKPGYKTDLLTALGNGFDTSRSGRNPLLLGGGIGIAPLYGLAKTLRSEGKYPVVILGFNRGADVIWLEEFSKICPTFVATVDGTSPETGTDNSYARPVTKGFVTDAIRERGIEGSYFYACGPMPMLRALCLGLDMPGEVSLESRMGCGFGACMCCSLETAAGPKRICKDGPIFRKEELIWK